MKVNNCAQYSDEWWLSRIGKPSASNASKIITSTGAPSKSLKDYAIDLAANMYAEKDLQDQFQGNKFTEFGLETEANARDAYQLQNDIDVIEVGFVSDELEQYIVSPDGMVGDDGLVEFKCLPKQHIKSLLYYKKHNNPPTAYIAQVQMQLFVTERKWCDLMFYSDDLPNLTIRVYPDDEFIKSLEVQLTACIYERNLVLKVLKEF